MPRRNPGGPMLGLVGQRLHDARGLIRFATAMAFAAGVIAYLRHDATVHGMPLPLFTGLVCALVVGTAAAVTSIVLPALGVFIEAAAIARLGAAVAAFGSPEVGTALQHSPLLSATVIVGGTILIRKATAHPAAGRWPVLGLLPSRRAV